MAAIVVVFVWHMGLAWGEMRDQWQLYNFTPCNLHKHFHVLDKWVVIKTWTDIRVHRSLCTADTSTSDSWVTRIWFCAKPVYVCPQVYHLMSACIQIHPSYLLPYMKPALSIKDSRRWSVRTCKSQLGLLSDFFNYYFTWIRDLTVHW